MRAYVVRPGDYLSKLAHQQGFNADEVWYHDKNTALRELRSNQEMIAPGDVLYLPLESQSERQPVTPGIANRYSAKVPTLRVSLVLKHGADVLADEPYVVEGLPAPLEGTTDGHGCASFEVPVNVREVSVVLYRLQRSYAVKVGHLDPISELSGVRQRLEHLGYYGWALGRAKFQSQAVTDQPGEDHAAIRAFQLQAGLAVTGAIDDATREALLKCHGS